jgi:predicted DsbA family dithiol-disulfide isomerase
MSKQIRIDFVSDVSCPWCAIGLKSLEQALERVQGEVSAELHFQPFELNPAMPPEGQDIGEHLFQKYGASPEQSEKTREMIRARGAEVGFVFELGKRSRIYNTFDAHRLLHWAESGGRQHALKMALLTAYFTRGDSPADRAVLLDAVAEAGLDRDEAARVLLDGRYGAEVREREAYYQQAGINSVPAIIINERHLISGGQPVEVFEQALRQIASQP